MAVPTDPQVFDNLKGRPWWCSYQTKGKSQPLTVRDQHGFLLLFCHVMEHKARVRTVTLLLQPGCHRLQLCVYLVGQRVRFVGGYKGMDLILELNPAGSSFLLHLFRIHELPHFIPLFPPPCGRIDVGEQHVCSRIERFKR
uniref:Uncharacterized protein n=1 Tax=Triticum urartu TaxID=4572 RepID=A0A8R7QT40_TRIUA